MLEKDPSSKVPSTSHRPEERTGNNIPNGGKYGVKFIQKYIQIDFLRAFLTFLFDPWPCLGTGHRIIRVI